MPHPVASVDKKLTAEPYFHGYIQREDLKMLLLKNGDFVVRLTEPRPTAASFLALSMMFNEKAMENGIKHYILFQKDGQYFIEKKAFPSVSALVDYYMKTKESLVKGSDAVISRPVPRQQWEHNHEDVMLIKKLGVGAFGEVSLGKLVVQGKTVDVAVRVAHLEEKWQTKEMMAEARLMRRLNHPNVCRFYGVTVGSEPFMVIMELANNGALDYYLKKNKLPIEKLNEMVMQAAWGVEYIHGNNILHRDIAARNCLYGDGNVKIADFGLSMQGTTYQNEPHALVPIRWIAPETLTSATYTQKTDVWAFGVLAWEIYHNGDEPYPDMTTSDVARSVINSGYRMPFQPSIPQQVADIITNRVWAHDSGRSSMAEVAGQLQEVFGLKRPDAVA